jgi:hypothetical protein
MPDKVNQKHGVPRIAGGTRFTPRRSAFLDGTIPTYFGPGQRPDAIADPYHPPTDWPAAGRLLRVPQVVWLSRALRFWHSIVLRTETGIIRVVNESFNFTLSHSFTDYDYPDVAENLRLGAVFAAVQARIAALRPGRTFVLPIDWFETAYWIAHDFVDVGGRTYGYPVADNFPHLEAPLLPAAPYFGTQFLHVFAGNLYEDRTGVPDPPDPGADPFRVWFDSFGEPGLAGNAALAASTARVRAALSRFAGYRVLLYPTSLVAQLPPTPPPPFQPSDADLAVPGDYPFFAWSTISYPANPLANYAKNLTVFGDSLAAMGWDEGADGPNPVAIGGTTTDLTEDALVALIAAHFGFDPDTGADLG